MEISKVILQSAIINYPMSFKFEIKQTEDVFQEEIHVYSVKLQSSLRTLHFKKISRNMIRDI